MKKFIFLLIAVCILSVQSQSQTSGEKYVPGELLVQLKASADGEALKEQYESIGLEPVKLLSARMNAYLCEYDQSKIEDEDVLYTVRQSELVKLVQFNHYVKLRDEGYKKSSARTGRGIPNDPMFDDQWALNNTGQTGGTPDADIDAVEAWDFYQGGPTALGDEVVIAIVDDGMDIEHEDINYWKNEAEIPDNGEDDDNNGYVDDYDGWDAYSSDGTIPSSGHGTHVAGIAAAVGNNATGVSGVNQDAKIMPIAGSSGTEDVVVEAYGYVLEMRARYNESRGDEGAFVVVTNASFGVNYGNPDNYPIWCAMYDSLGNEGILNSGATANINIDIDVEGDVPTACPSNYMVAVTNTTHNDQKNSGAAYGATTIDIGAPGTNILSTYSGNDYSTLSGTSMATPTVTGAIALMYSAANSSLMQSYLNDPANTALVFKEYLLEGVDIISDLETTTVSGGRLNIFNSMLSVFVEPDSVAPTTVNDLSVTDTTSNSLKLSWTAPHDTSRNGVVGYEIRFSENPINDTSDFNNAEEIVFEGELADSGETEMINVSDLDFNTVYYFAIRAFDIWGNASELSNVATGKTFIAPEIAVEPGSVEVAASAGSVITDSIEISNITDEPSTLGFDFALMNNTFPEDKVNVRLKPEHNDVERNASKTNPLKSRGVSLRGSGGPDDFGYEWIDSYEENGPEYEWNDISSTGTEASDWTPTGSFDAMDEGYAGPIDIGFNFKFYGQEYIQVYIGSNGFITFEPFDENTYPNDEIPDSEIPNALISAFWDDLDGTSSGEVYYQQDGNEFIIQYNNWGEYSDDGTFTYQIVLSSSGKINVYYNSMTGDPESSTIGIENLDGSDGLQVANDAAYIEDELALEFAAEPEWLLADAPSGLIYNDNSVDIELEFLTEDIPLGEYSMDVVINSNDPDNPEVTVPVTVYLGVNNWTAEIDVSNSVKTTRTLTYGQHPLASERLDTDLGEEALTDLSPFESYFTIPTGEDSYADLRGSINEELSWELLLDANTDDYPVEFSWDIESLPDGSFHLVDTADGSTVDVDMRADSSFVLDDSGIDALRIEYIKLKTMLVTVNEGWNIVSVPMNMGDMTPDGLFPTATSEPFAFNGGYVSPSELEMTEGYWLKFGAAEDIAMLGQEMTGDTIDVTAGWNIVGSYAQEVMVEDLTTTPSGIISSQFYGFDETYKVVESLVPGKGVWVKVSQDGQINLGDGGKSGKAGVPVVQKDWTKLKVVDADGSVNHLYLSNNKQNLSAFDLPPVPPEGAKDVRFGSGRFVESKSQGSVQMELNSLSYPVKVSLEGESVRIEDAFSGKMVNGQLRDGEQLTITNNKVDKLIVQTSEVPVEYKLSQNYPNPFNPSTKIEFGIPAKGDVKLAVYNVLGEKVAELVNRELEGGYHEVEFDAGKLSSGIYIYKLESGDFTKVRKMILMK